MAEGVKMENIRDFIKPTETHMNGQIGGFDFTVIYDGLDAPNDKPLATYYLDKYHGITRGFNVITQDHGLTYKIVSAVELSDSTQIGTHYAMLDDGTPVLWIYFHDDEFAFAGDSVPCYTIGLYGELTQVDGVQFAARFNDFGELQGWDLC